VRLGIGSVRGIGSELAREIATHRPYASIEELVARVPALSRKQVEALATSGAFTESFGDDRRHALWEAGAYGHGNIDKLQGIMGLQTRPTLPGMEPIEEAIADWSPHDFSA
jgi:error-prone DNA polymerase